MPNYLASWLVLVVDADNPVDAAHQAFELSRDEHRSLWCIENTVSEEMAVVDLADDSVLLECEEI